MTTCPVSQQRIARADGMDRTVAMLRGGYPYLLRLRQAMGSDAVQIRLLGRRTTVVSGADGARLFNDGTVMRRRGAMPRPLRMTLFGTGAIHGLDGERHAHRKHMFLSLLSDDAAHRIAACAARGWAGRSTLPQSPGEAFDAAVEVHGAAIQEWAGLPVGTADPWLVHDLACIVDGFGSLGWRHLLARRARRRADQWATRVIERVRRGLLEVPAGSAAAVIAGHRDERGRVLPPRVAAVELLNILRPAVAVAYFVAFAAQQLALDPELAERLRTGDDAVYEAFAHELRRVYPFVPMLSAKVRRRTEYRGMTLPRGRRVLLDVYGTLHDPAYWPDAERFELDRFLGVDPDPYGYCPQGAGDPARGHRCPGERTTVELVKVAARALVQEGAMFGRAPIPLRRMPTRPAAA